MYPANDLLRGCAFLTVLVGFAVSVPVAAGPVFHGIGDLSGGGFFSRVTAVSADGHVAVGASSSGSGAEAFQWTLGGGIVGLGDLPGGRFSSGARDVSADGSVIVGSSRSNLGTSGEAFRWQGGVMHGLGDFDGGSFSSVARAVSADGTVVAGGGTHATGNEPFVWRGESGLTSLGDLPGGSISGIANAMSASGAVIVGSSNSGNPDGEAFRWTQETGMVGLGFLEGSGSSGADAISSDGTAIVGLSSSLIGTSGFLWTELSGMINLGARFRPGALSDDASIVVGSSFGQEALIWTEDAGLRLLREVLESDYSLDLTGWTLEDATDISADGNTIVGFGTNPLGQTEGWIFVVPEPSTLVLLAAGIGLSARRRRGRH